MIAASQLQSDLRRTVRFIKIDRQVYTVAYDERRNSPKFDLRQLWVYGT